MGEADLSKIVGLIMENPNLIAEIKALAEKEDGSAQRPSEAKEEPTTVTASIETAAPPRSKRRELLSALKPYLSEERCKAVDQMISLGEILDMMRNK